jgi:starch-binding outer membrane protein, SusD/RagB family
MRLFNSFIDKEKLNKKGVEQLLSERGNLFRNLVYRLPLLLIFLCTSCNNFLDVVPDNVATIENAFTLRNEAERYLFTCYSYMPLNGDGWYNIGMMSGDEIWLSQTEKQYWNPAFRIAQGQQNKSVPLLDAWTGSQLGAVNSRGDKRLFTGIRDCNVFLENMNDMSKVPDISDSERSRWIGEAEFLKAYYHYYLLRMYGPIPIIDKNTPIDGDNEYAQRMPFDDCVNYISSLLDSAAQKLPPYIANETQEMGRVTQPIVLSIKAKLWLLAASPLFNGNSDYANFADKEGTPLFSQAFDITKWEKARDAAKAAIDAAESAGHQLFVYKNDPFGLNDTTKVQLSIRQAVTEPWNREHVWANSNSYFWNQNMCQILLTRSLARDRLNTPGIWGAPLKIAKMFYTSNGVPIDEDKTLDFNNYEQLRTSTKRERFNIEPGYTTARLNFDREPRFYADLGFDGGVWYKKDSPSRNDINTFYAQTKYADKGGAPSTISWNETGYYLKKLVNWEQIFGENNNITYKMYPWPEIRLADLYLMYSEALNEAEPASATAITYLDKVRERAGLKGVVDSWSNFSKNPSKYTSQEGLRDIIHRERLIELAFEGHRFWDLRRWKEAATELNKDITGWTFTGTTSSAYHRERVIFSQTFITPRDYLWPIGDYDTRRNPKLVENPGW